MLLKKALRLDEAARFEPCLLHAKELRDKHIKCVGCVSTRHRLIIGRVFPIRYRTKHPPSFSPSLVKANLCHAPQCHAALFWADLVLDDIRSVFPIFAITDSQSEARHVVIELNMFDLARGHFELGYSGLSEFH